MSDTSDSKPKRPRKRKSPALDLAFREMLEVVKSGEHNVLSTKKRSIFAEMAGDGNRVVISLNDSGKHIHIETCIYIDSNLVNVKTYSTLVNIAYGEQFCVTGLLPNKTKSTKLFLSKDFHISEIKDRLLDELGKLNETISIMYEYLGSRHQHEQELTCLDLSMFSHIHEDMFSVSLTSLGEAKEFSYGSWEEFIKQAPSENASKEDIITLLRACEEFENKNNLLLAEVGEIIHNELDWAKQFAEQQEEDPAKRKFYIN